MIRVLFKLRTWLTFVALMVFSVEAIAQGVTIPDVTEISTPVGSLRGKVSPNGTVIEFKGIRYALPPVGELRWATPQPVAPWTGTLEAFVPGPPCPQVGQYASKEEDCLFLNVTVPNKRRANLPVMVFIHGGGQVSSAASDYNADWLVAGPTPVIYVSLHYRLNIFAFFAHENLTAQDLAAGSGNYAALDQIAALKWVRDNISAFGGNPDNVTVLGQSGGAQAVCILMASPFAQGLFHRAISQSGPCQWQHYQPLTLSESYGKTVAAELGCIEQNPIPCLRRVPVSKLLEKAGPYQPAWGGGVLPLPIREAMASGRFNRVPLIQGATSLEALWTIIPRYEGAGAPLTEQHYPVALKEIFGSSRVQAILGRYPLSDYSTPLYALAAVLSDASMATNGRTGVCVNHLADQLVSPHVPVFSYIFSDGTAPYPAPIFQRPTLLGGAAHTKELSYLFDQGELTSAQKKISDTMIRYWTNFAANGDPNGNGLPLWPQYNPAEPAVMNFKSDAAVIDTDVSTRHNCKFWAELGYASLSGPYPTPTSQGPNVH